MNTQSVNKRIIDYIGEHHIFTLATVSEQGPWCATCFYVYLEESNQFIFTTDPETRHGAEMLTSPQVAGAIALETSIVGKIRGVQFTGRAQLLEGEEYTAAKKRYIKRFPIAAMAKLNLWSIHPDHYKMTDNRLGFGKKLIWSA